MVKFLLLMVVAAGVFLLGGCATLTAGLRHGPSSADFKTMMAANDLKGMRAYLNEHPEELSSVSDERQHLLLSGPKELRVMDIEQLLKNGNNDAQVITQINNTVGPYGNFSARENELLKKMGFSSKIVTAMSEVTNSYYQEQTRVAEQKLLADKKRAENKKRFEELSLIADNKLLVDKERLDKLNLLADQNLLAEQKLLATQYQIAEQKRLAKLQRLEEQKRLEEERRLAKQKIIDEKNRIAEEKRLAKQKVIDEKNRIIEEKRLAKQKRIDEKNRIAEEKRLAKLKLIEEKRLAKQKLIDEKNRLAEERLLAKQRRLEEKKRAELPQVAAVVPPPQIVPVPVQPVSNSMGDCVKLAIALKVCDRVPFPASLACQAAARMGLSCSSM